MDQPKLERLLRLMKLLTANNTHSVEEIADKLSISPRSVYRYIDTFREAGFVVKKSGNCIKLDKSSPYFKDISELIHFTEEEAYILKSAIESIDENNVLKQNLKKKLYTVYDYKIIAETIVQDKNSHNVQHLVEAIESRKSVVLKNYSSAHGNDIRDRKVEAFAFTTNYVQIWCYCPEEKKNKLFKVSRIGSVEILPDEWKFESQHKVGFIDIFRMTGEERHSISLKLSLRAASLLTEEYPLAGKYLTKLSDSEWILNTEVCSLDGVGRFIAGLGEEIKIISPNTLKEHLIKTLNQIIALNSV